MTEEQRKFLLKKISFAVGMAGSVKPERIAESVLSEMQALCKIEMKENV